MDPHQLIIPLLAMAAVGGVFYVLAYPYLSGQATAEKRRANLQSRSTTVASSRVNDAAKRRKQVSESLKEIETRNKTKKVTLETKLLQAGVAWTRSKYQVICGCSAVAGGLIAMLVSGSLLWSGLTAVVFGFGLPSWFISFKRKRRMKKFIEELPGAVDIIVRGIKAGIPLGDCIRAIANEAQEPVKTEFRLIVEAQAIGLSIAEAVERVTERVPLPETNFFSIVINIQQKAGGNLAEALSNLSGVLRDRKKMRGKVKAMSSEAKASAGIIGALPPLVATAVYVTSPGYMKLLFTTFTGHMVLGFCAIWMGIGVFVMKKMVSFDI